MHVHQCLHLLPCPTCEHDEEVHRAKELAQTSCNKIRNIFHHHVSVSPSASYLKKMVTSEEWNQSKWPKEAGARKLKQYILQDSFWRNIAYALKISSPLVKVLRMVDGEKKPPMGYIYAAMDRAKDAIAKSFKGKKEKYAKVFEVIDKR